MLQALREGKLSLEQENMEDILTSTVFGLLKYFDSEAGLQKFLALASSPYHPSLVEHLGWTAGTEVAYEFWPDMAEEGCKGCQPDVLITLKRHGQEVALIAIEAKYLRGKSSKPDKGPLPNDQLAREWENVSAQAQKHGSKAVVVYVTADYVYPSLDFRETQTELKEKGRLPGVFYWLSWRELSTALGRSEIPAIKDLIAVIQQKYQLTPLRLGWDYKSEPNLWRYRMSTVRFAWPGPGSDRRAISWRYTL